MRRVRTAIGADELHQQIRRLTGAAKAERKRLCEIGRMRYIDTQVHGMTRGKYPMPTDAQRARDIDDGLG